MSMIGAIRVALSAYLPRRALAFRIAQEEDGWKVGISLIPCRCGSGRAIGKWEFRLQQSLHRKVSECDNQPRLHQGDLTDEISSVGDLVRFGLRLLGDGAL
jgi:hypothetical protein